MKTTILSDLRHQLHMTRRAFISACAFATAVRGADEAVRTTQVKPEGFFTLGRRKGRWFFLNPQRRPFFSIGLNHIDSAPLRYAESAHIWREKYRNLQERWLRQTVAPDLRAWGFNSVGWVQEVVTRGLTNHRHSPNFTFEEYQWLGMPYCHLLPFAETHQWEAETRNPDFFSAEFADWCDYVARAHCARLADDPKLIGYFYVDCPTWVHTTKFCAWKGPLFDPARLATEAGRAELSRLATQYYRVTHDSIRRYDKHHLILGDRYEAKAPLPEQVVRAALPFVDVLSFQHFGKPAQVKGDLAHWHELSDKPVLLADGCQQLKQPDGTLRQDGKGYADTLAALRESPGSVGFHLCGAYLRNRCRQRGLRDEQEKPDAEALTLITQANREMTAWVKSFEKNAP